MAIYSYLTEFDASLVNWSWAGTLVAVVSIIFLFIIAIMTTLLSRRIERGDLIGLTKAIDQDDYGRLSKEIANIDAELSEVERNNILDRVGIANISAEKNATDYGKIGGRLNRAEKKVTDLGTNITDTNELLVDLEAKLQEMNKVVTGSDQKLTNLDESLEAQVKRGEKAKKDVDGYSERFRDLSTLANNDMSRFNDLPNNESIAGAEGQLIQTDRVRETVKSDTQKIVDLQEMGARERAAMDTEKTWLRNRTGKWIDWTLKKSGSVTLGEKIFGCIVAQSTSRANTTEETNKTIEITVKNGSTIRAKKTYGEISYSGTTKKNDVGTLLQFKSNDWSYTIGLCCDISFVKEWIESTKKANEADQLLFVTGDALNETKLNEAVGKESDRIKVWTNDLVYNAPIGIGWLTNGIPIVSSRIYNLSTGEQAISLATPNIR